MSKFKLCLLIAMVLVVAVGVTTAFSVAGAVDEDLYIEADISLSSDSILGSTVVASVDYWTSSDRKTWERATDFDESWCDVVYFDADGNKLGLTAPQTVGKYVVRVIVNDNYHNNNYFLGKEKLAKDVVLASYSYQIAYENLAVVFAPNKQVDYFADKDYYTDCIDGTKVYYKGVALVKDVDYSITLYMSVDDVFTSVDTAINPGVYKVEVVLNDLYPDANVKEENDKVFSSTFTIVNSIANLVKLDSKKVYEGMYQSDEALRNEYYSVKYQGLLTTEPVFEGSYEVSYFNDRQPLESAPQTVGSYVVRFIFNTDISEYGIQAGDFVDLDYEIASKPYSVTYENTAVSQDGFSIIYQGKSILITPVFDRDITIKNSETKYYKYTDDVNYSELSHGSYPVEVGKYKVRFFIDISDGSISGASMFGVADADYVIDANNNVLEFDFQIIPRLSVNFNSDYDVYGRYSSILDYTGRTPKVVSVIKDSSLADIPETLYSIKYYDSNWVETSAIEPGEYHAVVTFDSGNGVWTSGSTSIDDNIELTYDFLIKGKTPVVTATKISGGIILGFGNREVNPSHYSVSYYRVENSMNYKSTQSALVNEVGKYRIRIVFNADNFDLGIAKNDVIVLDYENVSDGSLSNVIIRVDNVIDNGDGYYFVYDGNVKVADVDFVSVNETAIASLNYSVYYQKLIRKSDPSVDDNWLVCDYPKSSGDYRVVFVVNKDNVAFNAKSGDKLYYYFSVRSLTLSPTFSVKVDEHTKDLVYDNNPNGKDFDVSFRVNGRPVKIDAYDYVLRFAPVVNGEIGLFVQDKPIDAGDYVIAVYFNHDLAGKYEKFGIFTDEPALINPEDFTAEAMADRSIFSNAITVEKLALTLLVEIPVEEKGMYDLSKSEVTPSYVFFKTNGFDQNATPTSEMKLDYVSVDRFDSILTTGSLNSISCDKRVYESINPGRYVNKLSLKDDARKNMYVDRVIYTLVGAKDGSSYSSDIYCASSQNDYELSVNYRVTPLPLELNAFDLESVVENSFAEHYYGNTAPVSVSGLTFSTVDKNGVKYDVKSVDASIYDRLVSYVSVKYYRRLTGETVTDVEPIGAYDGKGNFTFDLGSIDGYLFDAGDYALRITFDGNDCEDYAYFTLVNGKDQNGSNLNGNELEQKVCSDILFTVKRANDLRVVFERNFESFVYDGNPKPFNVVFMSGNNVVDIPYTLTKLKIVNGVEEVFSEADYPSAVNKYAIRVSFTTDIFKYRINQGENAGVYEGTNDNYISNGSSVKFYYSITNPQYLSWDFLHNGSVLTIDKNGYIYDFTGESRVFYVRFFNANSTSLTVNLIPDIDYDIWYYRENEDGRSYTRLSEIPTVPGRYVAELVFLRTLYDYKINDQVGNPYGYADARQDANRFGLSLNDSSNNELTLPMFSENRFLKYEIVRSKVLVDGVSASNKQFDNTDGATLTGSWQVGVSDDGKLIDGMADKIISLLYKKVFGTFDGVGVGDYNVSLWYKLTDDIFIPLPQKITLLASGVSARQFVQSTIDDMRNKYRGDGQILSLIDEYETKINEIYAFYDVIFDDVSATIGKRIITIKPHRFTREFDPFYRDAENLSFEYSDDLLTSLYSGNEAFVGYLQRENGDVENSVGSYRILLGTLGLSDVIVTLSDSSTASLSDVFTVRLDQTSAYYVITKRAITVQITDGLVKYYDQDDPAVTCAISSGSLINGDRLLFDGVNKPTRAGKKDRDDVGLYDIDFSPVTIVDSQGNDNSANYKMSFVKCQFSILPREIFINPSDLDNAKYTDNFYSLYSLSATDKRYSVRYEVGGILKEYTFNDGYYLYGNFGLEQVSVTDVRISAKYKITLGNVGVFDPNGKNVSSNYVISSSVSAYYTVIKTNVVFELVDKIVEKTYSTEDPIIRIRELKDFPLPEGYSLREDSSAVRKQGEDVGKYDIVTNDSSKIYIIDDATGEVVTKYFYINIRNNGSTEYPEGTKFVINKYPLYVSIREGTFVKGDSTIIVDLVFKNSEGKNVPQSILDKLTVTFNPIIVQSPLEGTNPIEPTYNSPDGKGDPNFEINTERGVITVIFPENNVTYKPIDDDEKVMKSNAYIFVNGMLLENKQMYLASTDNGRNPTKMVTISLPVKDELIGKKIFVVAVRSDGKYEILNAEVTDGHVVITDDEFNYIILCESKTWPYVVIIVIGALLVIGIVAIIVAKIIRRKKRGGKKAINFRKVAKESEKIVENNQAGYKPTANATVEDEFGDIPDNVDVLPVETVEPTKRDGSRSKKKKDKSVKESSTESTSEVLSDAKPSTDIAPSTEDSVKVEPEEVKPIDSSSDEIIISPSSKLGGDVIDATDINPSSYISTSDADSVNPINVSDDEIIISTSRKLGEDDK